MNLRKYGHGQDNWFMANDLQAMIFFWFANKVHDFAFFILLISNLPPRIDVTIVKI